MLQTVQFDTAVDPVGSVLDGIAKSYGFSSAASVVSVQNAQPNVPFSPPKADVPTRTRLDWREVKEKRQAAGVEKSATEPWNISNTKNFILEITPTSRKLFALMVAEGDVSAWQVTEFIGTQTLKGIFSSIGAAKTRTRGLTRARKAYLKRRGPDGFHYVMTDDFRELFMDAFLSAGLDKLLDEAEEFLKRDHTELVGEAG